jgi:hypothetical protein
MRKYEDGVVDVKGMYEFVHAPDGDEMHIQLPKKAGIWEGTEYRYGKVGFNPDEGDDEKDEDERLTLAFEYDIITVPRPLQGQDIEDEVFYAFENMLGDILVDILEKDLESKQKNENRNTNTETSVSE